MKWEVASAATGSQRLYELLTEDWEPFAATATGGTGFATYHLRRVKRDTS